MLNVAALCDAYLSAVADGKCHLDLEIDDDLDLVIQLDLGGELGVDAYFELAVPWSLMEHEEACFDLELSGNLDLAGNLDPHYQQILHGDYSRLTQA